MTIVKNKMQNLLAVITIITNEISFILKTKTLSIIRLGQLPVVMIIIAKIVSNVVNTTIKAQTSLCQMTATLLIMRPGRPFFLATIMPAIHRIALQAVMIHQAITTHQIALLGAVIHGVVVVLMVVALAAVGKQKKKTCTNQ